MKRTLLQVVACLAIIVAGMFFTTTHAEAAVFAHPSATGCTAPVGGDSVGPCATPSPNKKASVSVPAPKHHWHHRRHWHFHRHFHFRHHHFRSHHFRSHHHHWSFHHHGGHHGHHGHHGHSGGHHGRHH